MCFVAMKLLSGQDKEGGRTGGAGASSSAEQGLLRGQSPLRIIVYAYNINNILDKLSAMFALSIMLFHVNGQLNPNPDISSRI